MKICIDIPGNTTHGLWSPERGESRWAQNWAALLASQGHEVTCIALPGEWGSCPPVPNVSLVQHAYMVREKVFDLYMNACWWLKRDIGGIRARAYVHTHFGFESHLADEGHVRKNHIIAYPFKYSEKNFMCDENPFKYKTFCLPVPVAKEFGKSHFDKTQLTFSQKDVFLDRQSEGWFKCGQAVFEAMKIAQDKYGYLCNFFCGEQLMAGKSKSLSEYGINNLLDSINPKKIYFTMPYNDSQRVLSESKMALPVICAGGSTLDSAIMGVLPLAWAGGLLEERARKYDWVLGEFSTGDDIKKKIEMALSNRSLYDNLLGEFQQELSPYLYDSCLRHFDVLVDWVKKNC